MPEPPVSTFAHSGFRGWIGAARTDITPPVGIYARNWGAALHDVAEGVHRPLTATALTLQEEAGKREESEGKRAAAHNRQTPPLVLVSLDLGWWRSAKDEWYVREYVLQTLEIEPSRLLLHFTHTHAGPVLCRDDVDKPGGQHIAPYLDFLREAIVNVVQAALDAAVSGCLEWEYGVCGLAVNRDLLDEERARFVCGFNPSVPADTTLLVGRAVGLNGKPLATLVNYACHPTTLAWENRLLSPDWVGAMRELVEAHTDNAPCLFLQGASGELSCREQYTADTTVADTQGRQVGFAVLSTLSGMLPPNTRLVRGPVVESGAPLAPWKREASDVSTHLNSTQVDVGLPLQSLPSLNELDAQIEAASDRALRERLVRKRRIREGIGDGDTARMPAWVWEMGDALLVAHPNEAYSLLQTALRERFPQTALAVLNVTNGHFGYLPPAALYDEDIYAVWQSPFGRGSLERLIDACENVIVVSQGETR